MRTDDLTPKQQTVIAKLSARKTRYQMLIDDTNKQLSQLGISFEKNKELRERLKTYEDLLKKASDEINDIVDERNKFEADIEMAKKYASSAEARNAKWGFYPTSANKHMKS